MKSNYLNNLSLKKLKFKKIGKNCKISNLITFIGAKNISIGNNVRIDDFCVINSLEGYIQISDNTNIGSFCYLLGSSAIKIGKNCNISQGVKIYSKSNDYKIKKIKQYYKSVNVGDNVIVGSNSVILPGTTIGDNSRIGALTIVNKKIKKNCLFFKDQKKIVK